MSWKKIIGDLEDKGLTQTEIGTSVGCSQSYISDLKSGRRGQRLQYEIGVALHELHKKHCGSDAEEAA